MKIVELITDLNSRAGAEVFVTALTNSLATKRNDVYLIFLWNNIHPSFKEYLTRNNITFYCCDKKNSFDIIKSVKKMKALIMSINPDVVHTHGSVLSSYYFAFGCKKQSWLLVHTFHNVAKEECGAVGKIIRKRMMRTDHIVFVGISDLVTKTISDYYHIKLDKLKTIYNGIELKTSIGENDQDYLYDFVCVARFEKQKNHHFLLETVKALTSDYKTLKIALVGTGTLMKECQLYVHNNNLDDNVRFLGAINDVYSILKLSRCFILPSIFEGNPISILEAMCVGKPIIASKVGGVPDIVKNNRNGLLFESNNKDEFESCMRKLLENDNLIRQISENNVVDSKSFSIDECCRKYCELFEQN